MTQSPIRVLFVCHGNICRSTMAEFVLKDMVARRGLTEQFHIESAATSTEEIGNPVHPGTAAVLREHGIGGFEGKRARQLRREVAEEMDEAVRRLREQEEGSAQERLSRAVDIMGSTAFRLCEHRSADAVATMKLKACEEAGVRPRFSLEIPHNVGVPAVELCAVIANLADNGLAAALRAWDAGGPGASSELGASSASSASSEPGASGEPFLSLRSSVRQGHLVIEAKNSISEADRVAWEESAKRSRKRQRTWDEAHGWGLSIISGIAQRHGGSLECAIEDGVFRATVIMRLGSASDAAARGEAERTLPDRAACADDLELAGGVL